MRVTTDIPTGTATVEFTTYPEEITQGKRVYIKESQVAEYRKDYTVHFEQRDNRVPYVYKQVVTGYKWSEYLAELDKIRAELQLVKSHNFLITNEKEFMDTYRKMKKEWSNLIDAQLEQTKQASIIKLLDRQDASTLTSLIYTAWYHLDELYSLNGMDTISKNDRKILQLKEELDKILG